MSRCKLNPCCGNLTYCEPPEQYSRQAQQFQNMPDAPAVAPASRPPNPKQAFGDKKPPLAYIPLSAQLAELEALFDGRLKYDPLNWRDNPVEAMTYVEAAIRHLQLWKVGEERTRDTLVQNLGAVKACCSILIDAAAHGTLIDNRRHSKIEADLLHEAEAWVARLKEMQAEREKAKAANVR